ncbi:MAG: HEAT repeat domain-containing protein [Gemmatimonas sp.]|jgi:hypothetical protein|uniref:HEAT repeat domain-containing protein n=1 Tax=Gemmatimonas sp. TaxID=1962908 RepID=UPI00391F8408|nr:HEAT repeat domain-containing protein [Gemmatimonadota bacterium]
MPPLGYRRASPSTIAAVDSGLHHGIPDGPAARGTLRALALLVDRLATLGDRAPADERDAAQVAAVRRALRQYTSRIRDAAMLCRIIDGQFVLAGEPVDRGLTREDPLIDSLLQRCLNLDIGGITVRQGAAPNELLSLAQLLTGASRPTMGAPRLSSDTPTTMSSIAAVAPARELLRSWSVLVTRADQAPAPPVAPGAEQAPTRAEGATGSAVATALAMFAASRSDESASRAADRLLALLDDAERRGEAQVIEGMARSAMQYVHTVGTSGGRLAVERVLRRLQHRKTLEQLADRLPHTPDRALLLELFARAGEVGAELLVTRLMHAEDAQVRRTYFDSIVALDIGATLLYDLVHDPRWYVVRNTVALLGEMGLEHADVVVLPLLAHADDRIRTAAARALIRLGTAKALHGVQGAVDDPNTEVRRLAAVSYGLSSGTAGGVRPATARLAGALERETDEDVALEMLASLGKLGSADAIQRLLRVAVPLPAEQGERVVPRESYLRIAALEALIRARGQAVVSALEGLINDPDPEVAAAAARLTRS